MMVADMVDYSDNYQSLVHTLSEENGEPLTEEDHQFYLALFGDAQNFKGYCYLLGKSAQIRIKIVCFP